MDNKVMERIDVLASRLACMELMQMPLPAKLIAEKAPFDQLCYFNARLRHYRNLAQSLLPNKPYT
ncbi:hypothetical protein FOT57_24030 [Serratia ureilytica]|uniref:hypothetical protein n=1 Tax=Serratia ureilytica TaxID=300181 RepID=UPI0011D9C686|nr:hypothetical protein [Serratia ureilytica]MBS7522815.1 hypothetical protein [Serratia ureilytica]TXE50090.1 hypothetical protein FOT57_24030 [Serratia ureilytica]